MRSPRCARAAVRAAGLAGVCFLGMFGSVLTVGRELVSDYVQWSAADIALAEYVDEHAEPDALFLAPGQPPGPGVQPGRAADPVRRGDVFILPRAGLQRRYSAMVSLYAQPDARTLAAWGVDYAVFDTTALTQYGGDEDWYAQRYELWYENEAVRVYKIA